MEPGRKVQDATESAASCQAHGLLTEVVHRIEHAREFIRCEHPEAVLTLWKGLTSGLWSVVDHLSSDGRRYLLARRNPPGVQDPGALSARERDVLGYVALGHSNKFVGYMLGLAPSTVAGHLQTAQKKLGVASRLELIKAYGNAKRSWQERKAAACAQRS